MPQSRSAAAAGVTFRMKARARQVYPAMTRPEKLADHLASCSCHMCGNPRRFWRERTMQEMRAKLARGE